MESNSDDEWLQESSDEEMVTEDNRSFASPSISSSPKKVMFDIDSVATGSTFRTEFDKLFCTTRGSRQTGRGLFEAFSEVQIRFLVF